MKELLELRAKYELRLAIVANEWEKAQQAHDVVSAVTLAVVKVETERFLESINAIITAQKTK